MNPLVHLLNYQFLKTLLEFMGKRYNSSFDNWIVSVFVLERDAMKFRHADLLTSASVNSYGTDREHADFPINVAIPIDSSICGACLKSRAVAWVKNIETAVLYRKFYRPMVSIGVKAPDRKNYMPTGYFGTSAVSEYVFPIVLRQGTSVTIYGVINFECFDSEVDFHDRDRDLLTMEISRLSDYHAPLLLSAIRHRLSSSNLPVSDDNRSTSAADYESHPSEVNKGVSIGDFMKVLMSTLLSESGQNVAKSMLEFHNEVMQARIETLNHKR